MPPATPSSGRNVARVVAWGARAAAVLAGRGAVLAVFERSIYLSDGGGALACLGVPAIGLGPLNALADGMDGICGRIVPGTPWARDGDALRIGEAHVQVAAAAPWRPPPPRPRADVAASLAAALYEPGRPVSRGLAAMAMPAGGPFDAAAIAAARALGRAGAAGPSDLLGLGPGLTPAGDDFLGGAMVAWHAAGEPGRAAALWRLLAEAVPAATSRIAAAHLHAAAEGAGAAALHAALLGRPGALAALDRLGHTSGWDALAGAAAALRAPP